MHSNRGFHIIIVAFALGGGVSVLGNAVQQANAEPQARSASQPAPSEHGSSDRSRIAKAKSRTMPKGEIARPKVAPASSEPPAFMSEEYLKREKQTEDRLKRVMNICKGC